ncbi:hypothetical protein DEU35_2152 [Microbacterium sp. AG157]|uniref:hypothetical protein n=1 Tax=Microbacterium sp. AG157 TaxID=2183993 RepID=UPI000E27B83A|nr:hypothetical protein [Microbacterium sp. AG157]REC97659.1 hypothetical protein DEU35_2152 [Microbacterium sp. AG157]
MTGRYEQALINLAEGGAPFDVPATRDLIEKLSSLRKVVSGAAELPGIEGEAAGAAKAKFDAAAETIGQQIAYLEGTLDDALRLANGLRDAAREKLSALPAGSLSGGQETVVRSAAVGTTLFLGPISLLAGEGAVQAFNAYLAQQREQQAQGDFTTISQTLNGMSPPTPPPAALSSDGGRSVELEEGPAGTGTTNSGQRPFRGGDRSGNESVPVPRGPAPVEDAATPGPPPAHLVPSPDAPRGPGIDLGQVPPHYTPPTPDGSISGIGTLPGHISGPGSIGGSFPGGISGGGAGLGSGLSAGLIAGGGGAAALSRLSSGTGSSTAAAGRTISGSGGLLGKSGASATGAGLGGRSGTGSLGGGATGGTGTPGTGANAAAAGGRGAAAPTGAGGTGGGTAGAAGSRGAGGMGSGSRSDRRDERRGLGGPIAPRLEDDEETAPRSENAAAGSRDD